MKKKIIMTIVFLVLIIGMAEILADTYYYNHSIGYMTTVERGRIIELLPENNEEYLKIKILSGKYKNKYCVIENSFYQSDYYNMPFKKGEKVIIEIDDSSEKPAVTLINIGRDTYTVYLTLFFLLLLVLIGKKQGAKSAISLVITITIIIKWMIPFILNGYNPVITAIIACIVITMVTLFIVAGVSKKSIATILGTSFGVVTAGLLAFITGNLSHFSGLSGQDATSLMLLEQELPFDFTGILFAGIIVGTLGAVMDVSMSIASSMNEMKDNNPDIRKITLIKSGLNIGKDVMGTMTNTLILAYTGASIPLLMVLMAKHTPLVIILNTELITTEIIRALSGSIGIILSIPATSVISGILLNRKNFYKECRY